jgi:circadian clock protein KaiB
MAMFLFDRPSRRPGEWKFELYTDKSTPWGTVALTNLRVLCETYLPDRFEIEIVDATEDRRRARDAGVGPVPCVVRRSPGPPVRTEACRDLDRLRRELGIRPVKVRQRA